MPTILQLTDAHLSPRNELFRGNLALIHALAAAAPPDLTIASGDLSLDGADQEADMAFAAEEQIIASAAPERVIAGATVQQIIAKKMRGIAFDAVQYAVITLQNVVARAAIQRVAATVTGEPVITATAVQHIVAMVFAG